MGSFGGGGGFSSSPSDQDQLNVTGDITGSGLKLTGIPAGSGDGNSSFLVKSSTGVIVLSSSAGGGGGNVSNTGTPADNQVAIWVNADTIEGSSGLTYNGTTLGGKPATNFGAVTGTHGTFGQLTGSSLNLTGDFTTTGDITGNPAANLGAVSGTTLRLANLTSGRIAYATTNGQLTDDTSLTFDGTTLGGKPAAQLGAVTGTHGTFGQLTGTIITPTSQLYFPNASTITGKPGVDLGAVTGTVAAFGQLKVLGGQIDLSGSVKIKAPTPFISIDSTGAGQDSGITLMENGTQHWQIKHEGSNIDNSFVIRDVGSANVVVIEDNSGADKLHITSTGVGIGDSAPGTLLQVKGADAYLTLQNSTDEDSAGSCETKIIFEDHGNNALGQIEVSHAGGSDDEKGQMILSTNNDSGLQTAITISENQSVTFAGNIAGKPGAQLGAVTGTHGTFGQITGSSLKLTGPISGDVATAVGALTASTLIVKGGIDARAQNGDRTGNIQAGAITGSSLKLYTSEVSIGQGNPGTVTLTGSFDAEAIGAGAISGSTLRLSNLTANRVVWATSNGQLTDDGDFTFNGTTIGGKPGADLGAITGSSINVRGGPITGSEITVNTITGRPAAVLGAVTGTHGTFGQLTGSSLKLTGPISGDISTAVGALTASTLIVKGGIDARAVNGDRTGNIQAGAITGSSLTLNTSEITIGTGNPGTVTLTGSVTFDYTIKQDNSTYGGVTRHTSAKTNLTLPKPNNTTEWVDTTLEIPANSALVKIFMQKITPGVNSNGTLHIANWGARFGGVEPSGAQYEAYFGDWDVPGGSSGENGYNLEGAAGDPDYTGHQLFVLPFDGQSQQAVYTFARDLWIKVRAVGDASGGTAPVVSLFVVYDTYDLS